MHATAHDYDALWTASYGDMQNVGPVHRHMRRLLSHALEGLEPRTTLDVGCGAGHNAGLLRASGRVVGADVSENALEQARRRAPGDYRLLDIQEERLDETFDLVFSSLLLEHLPHDVAALGNMRAMCGRWLVVSTMAGNFDRYRAWDEQVGHVRNYATGELERKLADAGFDVVRATYWGYPFYSPLARLAQNRASAEPKFNRATRLLVAFLYRLYFLNSGRRGDLLVVLAKPSAAAEIESSSVNEGE